MGRPEKRAPSKAPHQRDLAYAIVTGATIGDFAAFHIDPVELEDLILTHGVGAKFWPSVPCPCVRLETGSPRIDCPLCVGRGFLYPEDLRQDTTVMISSRSDRHDNREPGYIHTGTAQATFLLGIDPFHGDLVFPNGDIHAVHETLVRAHQEVDPAQVRNRLSAPDQRVPRLRAVDRLLYQDADIKAVYWLNGSELRKANKGDFKLVGREIRWKDGHGPEPGAGYTVRYEAPACYICQPGEPSLRSEAGGAYPMKCLISRFDLWGRPDPRTLATSR